MAEAFELRLQGFGVPVSSYIVHMAPYLLALAVLAGLGRSSKLPAAIGQPLQSD
jgi:simple sugar transport system permease protein